MVFELKNKTVLITGASSGIGKDFAYLFALEGANLILVARSLEKLQELATELKSQHPIQVHVLEQDLSHDRAAARVFESVTKQKLQVDLLVNNAGFGKSGKFDAISVADNDALLKVNINSVVELSRLFLPGMAERKSGGIINIASTAAFQPLPYLSVYAATKAFILNFTEGLWEEYKNQGIRIFCLCPGNTKTHFHEVAGIQGKQVFLAADSLEVARFGLKMFKSSVKPSAIFGFWNNVLALGYRIFPRRAILFIVKWLYRSV